MFYCYAAALRASMGFSMSLFSLLPQLAMFQVENAPLVWSQHEGGLEQNHSNRHNRQAMRVKNKPLSL